MISSPSLISDSLHMCFTTLALQAGISWSSAHGTDCITHSPWETHGSCHSTKKQNNWLAVQFKSKFLEKGIWLGKLSFLTQSALTKWIHPIVHMVALGSPRASGSSSQGRCVCVLSRVQNQHWTVGHCVSPDPNTVWILSNISQEIWTKSGKRKLLEKGIRERDTNYRHQEKPRDEQAAQVFCHGFQIIIYQERNQGDATLSWKHNSYTEMKNTRRAEMI